jgi:hypothetical protein
MAYVLLESLRGIALQVTDRANASCGTIRRKLFKIGALVTISVRRVKLPMASGCPYKAVFATAYRALAAAAADTSSRNRRGGPRNASAWLPLPAFLVPAIPRLASGEHSGQSALLNRDNILLPGASSADYKTTV